MTTANSTTGRKPRKPKKPRQDYPLFPHACGQWAKKVRGKLFYFGTWDDPDAAEKRWDAEKDALRNGRVPRSHRNETGTTLRELCNEFLTSKDLAVEAGELSIRQRTDLHRACDYAVKAFGKDRLIDDILPADFRKLKAQLVKRYKSPSSLRREISNVRSIFFFAERNDLTEKRIKFGDDFKPPGTKAIKKHRNRERAAHGDRIFTLDQIRKLLEVASVPMKAAMLLSLNCGLGNADVKGLTFHHIEGAWLNYPRDKTGCPRRAKLWPETLKALDEYLAIRKEPKEEQHKQRVFVTKYGQTWDGKGTACPLSAEFRKMLRETKVNKDDPEPIYRKGLSYYTLRHCYRTIADATLDQPAVDLTMGHSRDDMASVYREHIAGERLERVSEHVRQWLFGEESK